MSNQLSFEINGRKADLPLYTGSEGETAIDISKLRSQTGTITLDPGYVNTGACTSGITFLNGEEGILRYRGYPIEQLAENSSFLEVSYLLIHENCRMRSNWKILKETLPGTRCSMRIYATFIRLFPKGPIRWRCFPV